MVSPRSTATGVVLLGRRSLASVASCYNKRTSRVGLLSHSTEPQPAVDTQMFDSVLGLGFAVFVADPCKPDCPLVACSLGFSSMTQYKLNEITGKSSSFLEQGVPDKLINKETRRRTRAFSLAAAGGYAKQEAGDLPDDLIIGNPNLRLGNGEELYLQTSARKSGELFLSMFCLKTVDLDDQPFVIGLQADLGDEFVGGGSESMRFREVSSEAFAKLSGNMDDIEAVLASQFNYSSSVRRKH